MKTDSVKVKGVWKVELKLTKACFRMGERWKRAPDASGPGEHYDGDLEDPGHKHGVGVAK